MSWHQPKRSSWRKQEEQLESIPPPCHSRYPFVRQVQHISYYTIIRGMMVFNVTCGDTSVDLIDGSYLSPHSRGIRIRKYFNGCGKVHVTGCRCNQWKLSVRVFKNDICLQKKLLSSFYSSKVIEVLCIFLAVT